MHRFQTLFTVGWLLWLGACNSSAPHAVRPDENRRVQSSGNEIPANQAALAGAQANPIAYPEPRPLYPAESPPPRPEPVAPAVSPRHRRQPVQLQRHP